MAGGIDVKVEFPELRELQQAFRQFRPGLARKHMGAAIRRSLKPGLTALRGNVTKGPTGNLARAITSKVKTYASGNAVGLVGFTAAGSGKAKSAGGGTVKKGKDRAFHAGFVEFGTKERVIKTSSRRSGASIASSFKAMGPFKIARMANRGKFAGVVRVNTSPKYPKAFFKKAPRGELLRIPEMPVGGRKGHPPVKTAYKESLGTMRSQLAIEMTNALLKAQKDLAANFPVRRNNNFNPGPTPF
jgi:hypothetical protein